MKTKIASQVSFLMHETNLIVFKYRRSSLNTNFVSLAVFVSQIFA